MKNRIISILVVILIIFSVTSCKRKPDSSGYKAPSSESEAGSQSQEAPASGEKQQQEREHFPLEDWIYDYEKIVDPETDPKAKVLYDAYGEGTVVVDHNNAYSIICYDLSAADYTDTTYKPDVHSVASRATVEHWENVLNLSDTIRFRGTPTERTVQKACYYVSEEGELAPLWGQTYVEFLVSEAYYGTVRPGDYVWVMESFAVGFKDGVKQIIDSTECGGYIFSGRDYLVGCTKEQKYYQIHTFNHKALRLDVEYTPTSETNDGIDYSRYKKYIIDKDIKLCREQEYERYSLQNYTDYYNETFEEHQGKPDFTYTDPQFAPTEEQKQIVEEQLLYYGERENRWSE
ncbi:MAG: hypothetical protein IJ408_01140 [Clostridia bacterium]|nr:hypothetical protein [Clostridia bacterium]